MLLKNDDLKQFEDAAWTSKVVCDHSLGQFFFPFITIFETEHKNNKVHTQLGGKSLDGVKIADKKKKKTSAAFCLFKLLSSLTYQVIVVNVA